MKKPLGYAEYAPLLEHFVSLLQDTLGDNLVSVVLYGSVARGTAGPESDVDLLLICRDAPPVYYSRLQPLLPLWRQLRQRPAWQALREEGITPEVNVLVLSQQEADQNRLLYLDMIEEAQILVDRDNFFRQRLCRLQERLQELKAQKIHIDGGWYWDLKPDLAPEEQLVL